MKNRLVAIVLAGVIVVSMSACTSWKKSADSAGEPSATAQTQDDTVSGETSVDEVETEVQQDDPSEQVTSEFDFSKVANLEFMFASGAGGWNTVLTIDEDGSFKGMYHDSDMGDVGDGYSDGTVYFSEFSGKFIDVTKKNDYTYAMKITDMKTENAAGTEEIRDDVRIIYADPYGLEKSEEILLYLPGAPLKELPDAFLQWVGYMNPDELEETELSFYGLYNVAEEEGFSSYEVNQIEYFPEFDPETISDNSNVSDIDQELKDIEARAQTLEDSLANDDLTQMEYNMKTGELYQLWDDELNIVWGYLKDTLSSTDMDKLRIEQRAWIKDRDAAIDAAGAEYEGGSIQPMIKNQKGAELTKTRVYELADILKAN